jgi:galactose oxidase-like protein
MLGPWLWTQRQDIGPAPRRNAAMAWCASSQRLVLFGGNAGPGQHFGDTWEWDGQTWVQVEDTGPSPRRYVSMAPTPDGGILLFGGLTGDNPELYLFGDTWHWNGKSWVQVEDVGPSRRSGAAMALDPASGLLVLHSGTDEHADVTPDTWAWDGTSWTQIGDDGPPRWDSVFDWDPVRGALTLFSGFMTHDESAQQLSSATWVWRQNKWEGVQDIGPALAHTAGCSVPTGLLIFGGSLTPYGRAAADLPDSTWAWDGALWRHVQDMGPPGRRQHAIGWDPARSCAVLFGGQSDDILGDTWELEPPLPDEPDS